MTPAPALDLTTSLRGDSLGMRLLDKIMILQGVKRTIQPPGVGYANSPKNAKMGGHVAFSPIYACLALI